MIDLKKPETIPAILTPKEIAELLRITPNGVRKLIKEGQIQAFRIGKRAWRIPVEEYNAYLLRCNPEARRKIAESQYAEHMELRRRRRQAAR